MIPHLLLRLLLLLLLHHHPAAATDYYTVDGSALGPVLHSIGAQSTAGTSRLLVDYEEPSRSDILDLLFKPSYGASLQHLKVEIGGDAQISCGAEPSPMRRAVESDAAAATADFGRGYEHWLMTEAKRRNPEITLLALVYAWPSWISPGSSTPYATPQSEQNAATYVSDWLTGVRTAHNITVNWVGVWNEQTYTQSYITTLRATLDAQGHAATQIVASDRLWDPIAADYLANASLRAAVDALTQHYPHCDATEGKPAGKCTADSRGSANALRANAEFGVPLWSSEDYSCWTDSLGAGVWAQEINSQFVGGNINMVSAWHLASAFYSSVAFWNEGMVSATQPWSGHFEASPTIWATAHTTQFTTAGKSRYIQQGKGSGALRDGGTYVSFTDGGHELSIVVETSGAAVGPFCGNNCNGHCQYKAATRPQSATFVVSNITRLQTSSPSSLLGSLAVWRTQLGLKISDKSLFERLPDIPVMDDGQGNKQITLTIDPDCIYTISSIQTATKAGDGSVLKHIPASAPFPLPYADSFEAPSAPPSPGRYWSDMEGAFEIGPSAMNAEFDDDGRATASSGDSENQVLKQAALAKSCCNFIPALDGPLPLSIIGSSTWENVEASISIAIPPPATAADAAATGTSFALFGIRAQFTAGTFFKGGLGMPTGLFMAVDEYGWQLLPSVQAAAAGLAWPPKPETGCLASAAFAQPGGGVWRRVTLKLQDRTAECTIDDTAPQQVPLPPTIATGGGFVAIASSWTAVEFDNFTVATSSSSSSSSLSLSPSPSRCNTKAAAGQAPVVVGCGEPAADLGARWDLPALTSATIGSAGNASAAGPIVLRSDASLCLTRQQVFTTAASKGATTVSLAQCQAGAPSQQWTYDSSTGQILAAAAGGDGTQAVQQGLQMGPAGSASSFAPVTVGDSPSTLWWSPDLGYIHSDSNKPMLCNCVAICGGV